MGEKSIRGTPRPRSLTIIIMKTLKLMKYIIIAVIVFGVVLGGMALKPEVTNYVAEQKIVEKEVVKEINPLDEQIKQREAELDEKYSKIKSVEARLDVIKAERTRLDTEIKALQKELAGFMIGTP